MRLAEATDGPTSVAFAGRYFAEIVGLLETEN
jgi:hypothetical protein